jgi:hypothetical protein
MGPMKIWRSPPMIPLECKGMCLMRVKNALIRLLTRRGFLHEAHRSTFQQFASAQRRGNTPRCALS